jgi:hypothetical protein
MHVAETSNATLFYVNRMMDKRMKVSTYGVRDEQVLDVKALYEGFIAEIEIGLSHNDVRRNHIRLMAGNEPEEEDGYPRP